jgi:anti-sigma regulatory factor (Ser/Thr protein kinase)
LPPSERALQETAVTRSPTSQFESHLTIPATPDRLGEVCDRVREAAALSGFDERTNYACQLAVCEAVENVILHGYRDRSQGSVEVRLLPSPGRLTVEITDDAPPFDPSAYPLEAKFAPSDPPVGGRGLLMIRRVMDDLQYQRRRGRNVLRLTKIGAFTGT